MAQRDFKFLGFGALGAAFALFLAGCETTGLGRASKSEATAVPEEGLLSAKLAALTHAMDTLPDEDRRYLNDDYAAYGLLDRDPTHEKFLVKLLEGRYPPVVAAESLYSRSSNAQWYDGKPALKWTASAVKAEGDSMRAEVVIGWLHSNFINRFTTYNMRYDGSSWQVEGVELLKDIERGVEGASAVPSVP